MTTPAPEYPLEVVLDAHTAPIDPEFIGTACDDCGVVVPIPTLAEHLIERHGHFPEDAS